MSYLKFFQRKSTFRSFICLAVTTAILCLSYSALKTSNRIYAAIPNIARIINVNNKLPTDSMITVHPSPDGIAAKGVKAVPYGNGPQKNNNTLSKMPAALKIPKDGSTAKLSFYNGNNFANFVADLGPNPQTDTTYTYPCTSGMGAATFGWNIQTSASIVTCSDLIVATQRSLFAAQSNSSAGAITVSPQRELTLIHTYEDNGNLVVDVLLGAIRVKSASNPTGILVTAGNQYIEPPNGRSRVQPIKLERAVRPPSVQDFFKLDDWSSDRAATELVRKFQESLQREPAPQ